MQVGWVKGPFRLGLMECPDSDRKDCSEWFSSDHSIVGVIS